MTVMDSDPIAALVIFVLSLPTIWFLSKFPQGK